MERAGADELLHMFFDFIFSRLISCAREVVCNIWRESSTNENAKKQLISVIFNNLTFFIRTENKEKNVKKLIIDLIFHYQESEHWFNKQSAVLMTFCSDVTVNDSKTYLLLLWNFKGSKLTIIWSFRNSVYNKTRMIIKSWRLVWMVF